MIGLAIIAAALAVISLVVTVALLRSRSRGVVTGGLRAESWIDRMVCRIWHGWLQRKIAYRFDPDGTTHRICMVWNCSMHVVTKPLYLRTRDRAREAATDELRKWARR